MEPIVDVHITGPDAGWLAAFTRRLIDDRLVASGNIVDGVRSLYRWQGEVHDEAEAIVILHTRASLVSTLIERSDAEHPYEVPGFRYFPMNASPAYHRWVIDQTGAP